MSDLPEPLVPARAPICPEWQEYARYKREWLAAHPGATTDEVRRALDRIAADLGL